MSYNCQTRLIALAAGTPDGTSICRLDEGQREQSYRLCLQQVWANGKRPSTKGDFGSRIPLASYKDANRLYPLRRRGTGGHNESHPDWRTSPENYCCFPSRKETSTRTDNLSDRL